MEGGSVCLEKELYKCGGCFFCCATILDLHFHLIKHAEGGSYFYNSLVKTAYPKSTFRDTDCQTNVKHTPDDGSDVPDKHLTVKSTGTATVIPETISKATQTDVNYSSFIKTENLESVDCDHLVNGRNKEYCREQCSEQSAEIKVFFNGFFQPTENSNGFIEEEVKSADTEQAGLQTWNDFINESEMPVDTGPTNCDTGMEYKINTGMSDNLEAAIHGTAAGFNVNADGNVTHVNSGKLELESTDKNYAIDEMDNKRGRYRKRPKCKYKGILHWERGKKVKKKSKIIKMRVKGGMNGIEYTPSANSVSVFSKKSVESENDATDCDNDIENVLQEDSGLQEKKSYLCVICNKNLGSRQYWEKHIEWKHYHCYSLQCEKCFYPFQDEDEIESHNCTLTAGYLHECLQCEDKMSFRLWTNLLKHVEVKHKGKYPLKCDKCRRRLLSEFEKRKHMIKHDPTLLTCSYCQKQLKNIVDFDDHLAKHTGESRFHCHLCEKRYRKKSYLKDHLMSIHGFGAKEFMCEKCGMSFGHSRQLYAHKKLMCGDPPYECSQCDKVFRHRTSLMFHMRCHSGELERPFICDMCGDSFTRNNSLQNHIKHRHTKEREFKCSMCDKAFVKICTLQRHERVHLKIRPYACEFCMKEFSTRWNLKAHLRQHTGDTPYTCSVCGLGFAHNVVRKTHEAKCVRNDV